MVALVVTLPYAATWRGTWQNTDALLDQVVFGGDKLASAVFSLCVGVFFSLVFIFFQHWLKSLFRSWWVLSLSILF